MPVGVILAEGEGVAVQSLNIFVPMCIIIVCGITKAVMRFVALRRRWDRLDFKFGLSDTDTTIL